MRGARCHPSDNPTPEPSFPSPQTTSLILRQAQDERK
jgi:hypothetical protein